MKTEFLTLQQVGHAFPVGEGQGCEVSDFLSKRVELGLELKTFSLPES